MIDPKELRIGNWIIGTTDGIGVPNQIQQVFSIDENYINPIYNHQGESYYIKPEDAEPIPLTEDILIKCGFKKEGERYRSPWFCDGTEALYILKDEFSFFYQPLEPMMPVRFESLHRLQNFFYANTYQEIEFKP